MYDTDVKSIPFDILKILMKGERIVCTVGAGYSAIVQ